MMNHTIARRAHQHTAIDGGLQQIAGDEVGEVIAPFGQILGAVELAVLGQLAGDDRGGKCWIELPCCAAHHENVVVVLAVVVSPFLIKQTTALVCA